MDTEKYNFKIDNIGDILVIMTPRSNYRIKDK